MGEEEEEGGFHVTRRLCWWTPPVRPAAGSLGVINAVEFVSVPERSVIQSNIRTQWMDPHSPPIFRACEELTKQPLRYQMLERNP